MDSLMYFLSVLISKNLNEVNMRRLGSKEGCGFLTVLKFGERREGEFMNKKLEEIM